MPKKKKGIDPDVETKLIGDTELFISRVANQKYGFERQWWRNIAFYYGHQWLGYLDNQYLLNLAELQDGKVRIVINRLQPMVQRQVARIVRGRPQLNVIAPSNEFEDQAAADCSEKVLQYLWEDCNVDKTLRQALFVMELTGTVFLYPHWNPNAGDVKKIPKIKLEEIPKTVINPETGDEETAKDLNDDPILEQIETLERDEEGNVLFDELPIGDIDIDIYSPFEVYPDQESTSMKDTTKLIVQKYKGIDYIRSKYGVDVEPESKYTAYNYFEQRLKSLFNSNLQYNQPNDKGAFVREGWEKPTATYPNGRHYIIAGNKVVLYQEYLIYGKIPLIDFHCVKHPDKFWADCYLAQAIPIQKQVNLIVSQVINNLKFVGNPKIVSYKNNGLQRSNFVADSGEVLEVNVGGQAPYVLQGASMPNQVVHIINYLEQKMNDIFSQHEVSQGQLPYRIESGPALQQLTEQDDAPVSLTVMDFEDQLEVVGRSLLLLFRDFSDDRDERLIKIVGKNNALIDAFYFKKANLLEEFDVRVKVSPGLPHSKAGKTEMVFSLFDKEMLKRDNPNDVRRGMDLLDLTFENAVSPDEKLEKANILFYKRGQADLVTVNPYDDHEIHAATCSDYMKTQDYLGLKQSEPQVAAMILAHWQEHLSALQPPMEPGAEQAGPPEAAPGPMGPAPMGAGPIPFPAVAGGGGV